MQDQAIDQRLVAGAPGVLELTPVDPEGEPGAITGPVTATVVATSAGAILADVPATLDGGAWTVAVDAATADRLDNWTVTWTDQDSGTSWQTYVDVVGRHLVTVAQVRAADPTLANVDAARIIRARLVAEAEAEWICDVAFTPRFRTVVVDGTGERTITVPFHACRTIRSIEINTTAVSDARLVADGVIERPSGWARGRANVSVAVEVGLDAPPPDLADAICTRIRTLLSRPDSNVPLRAIQWQPEAGGSYRLDRASRFRCGIPDVDAVYFRHSRRAAIDTDDKPAPASAPFTFDPRAGSMFHDRLR